MSRGHILVVDDDRESCLMVRDMLSSRGFDVDFTTHVAEAMRLVEQAGPFDAVLSDLRVGHQSGLDLARGISTLEPCLPVLVITAFGSVAAAVEAMRTGAFDFITKPLEIDMLVLALDRAVRHGAMQREVRALRSRQEGTQSGFESLLGSSPVMRRVFDTITRLGSIASAVLIIGESGTGKELAARAIHAHSARRQLPFVAVSCAAVSESTSESELFRGVGEGPGDGENWPRGLLTRAQGGTLFLDEIGELAPAMQRALSRALQELLRGPDREAPFDVRVIAATHRDLEAEVSAGRFRQDLFFQIQVIELLLPPLRTRGNDVLTLAEAFASRFANRAGKPSLRLGHEAKEFLFAYDWPGNVRELENCIEHAVALCADAEQIVPGDLPERVRKRAAQTAMIAANETEELVTIEEMERRYLLRVLAAVGNNKKLAAQVLGLDRSTLYRKLDRYLAS